MVNNRFSFLVNRMKKNDFDFASRFEVKGITAFLNGLENNVF